MPVQYEFLDPSNHIEWEENIDVLLKLIGAPNNNLLFPPYYIKASFPKNGGLILIIKDGKEVIGAGFLFPAKLKIGALGYIIRLHFVKNEYRLDEHEIGFNVERKLKKTVEVYFPEYPHEFAETHSLFDEYDIGRPNELEAIQIRDLQRQIWQSEPGDLYPIDIHTKAFMSCSSLVARHKEKVVGFGFGFYRYVDNRSDLPLDDLYIPKLTFESQLLGVLPEYRNRGLGYLLKCAQRDDLLMQNINLIHWTVDPLQAPNGVLNFMKLGAISYEFYPNYYSFRNILNRVPASRLGISWHIDTNRVINRLTSVDKSRSEFIDLSSNWQKIKIVDFRELPTNHESVIALEIPSNWSSLQVEDTKKAMQIRNYTDSLLLELVKSKHYFLTDIAFFDNSYYLVARKTDINSLLNL